MTSEPEITVVNTTGVSAALTTGDAAAVAISTFDNPDALESYIADLPAARVPLYLARVTALRKWLQQIEKMAESRITEEKIIPFGNEWPDPDTGVIYRFAGEPAARKVRQPESLRKALLDAGADATAVARAVYQEWKCSFTELNRLAAASRAFAEVIEDHEGERGFGPAHLKEAE